MFKFAVRKTEEICAPHARAQRHLQPGDLDLFVSHQANRRIIQSAAEKLGIAADEGRHQHRAVRQHHRRAPSRSRLNDASSDGRLKKGDLVLLPRSAPASRSARCCCAGGSDDGSTALEPAMQPSSALRSAAAPAHVPSSRWITRTDRRRCAAGSVCSTAAFRVPGTTYPVRAGIRSSASFPGLGDVITALFAMRARLAGAPTCACRGSCSSGCSSTSPSMSSSASSRSSATSSDFFWKANARNMALLEAHAARPHAGARGRLAVRGRGHRCCCWRRCAGSARRAVLAVLHVVPPATAAS